jgi:hypothetical protein
MPEPQCAELLPWINGDPMVADGRMQDLSGSYRDDSFGFLHRHMAIDAVFDDPAAYLPGHAADLPSMAKQAPVRIARRLLLRGMNIMTSRARHCGRRKIAAALLKQSNLIPVYVDLAGGTDRRRREELIQRLAGDIGKRRK